MRDRLILLPGWGLGVSPLEPLAVALRGLDERLRVEIEPLPVLLSADLDDWLDELDATLPDNIWLGGWSLGGMLASELASRRGDRCCGLVTLASNPSFVSREDWPGAMPVSTFEPFLNGFGDAPNTTLKRFCLLCSQGSHEARALASLLLAGDRKPSPIRCWPASNCWASWIRGPPCSVSTVRNCTCLRGLMPWSRCRRRAMCWRCYPMSKWV